MVSSLPSYWVSSFLAVSAFSSTETTTTSELQEFLRNGDIAKIIVIKNRGQAKVFLTDAALQKDVHKAVADKPLIPSTGVVPQYVLDFGDLQIFQNEINQIKTDNSLDTIVEFDTENNILGDLLLSLLPFALIIGYLDLLDAQNVRRWCWRCRRPNF